MVAEAKGPVVSVPIADKAPTQANGQARGARPAQNSNLTNNKTPAQAAPARAPRKDANSSYDASKSLYVSGIAVPIEREAVKSFLAAHGQLLSFECIPAKAIAFVEYATEQAAQACLANPLKWRDQPIEAKKRRAPRPTPSAAPSNRSRAALAVSAAPNTAN